MPYSFYGIQSEKSDVSCFSLDIYCYNFRYLIPLAYHSTLSTTWFFASCLCFYRMNTSVLSEKTCAIWTVPEEKPIAIVECFAVVNFGNRIRISIEIVARNISVVHVWSRRVIISRKRLIWKCFKIQDAK